MLYAYPQFNLIIIFSFYTHIYNICKAGLIVWFEVEAQCCLKIISFSERYSYFRANVINLKWAQLKYILRIYAQKS